MSMRFDGRVALVTGAGKGLGRAYALWLAERGASVVVNNRAHPGVPSSAQAVVDEIVGRGGVASIDEHPVEDETAARAMIASVLARYGRLDILVCNAGIAGHDEYFTDAAVASMHEIIDVNFWGTLYPVHAALPAMMQAGYGRIVLSTSQAGLFGQKRGVLYSASKAALIGLARGIACEIGDPDVRINLVAPAAYTPMSSRLVAPLWSEFMSPFKVAPVVGWLCSEACRASGMIFNAGAGRVRRARIMETRPVEIRDEDMGGCWPALDDMSGAIEATSSFNSGSVLMPEIIAAARAQQGQP